ncbi:MAG: hypothetical protein DRP84_00910 [Spirochaetes bacterium]|nr:MAG: hypothetical protein DRP84_00910 [Spirochaetota bacterium]
MNRLMIDNKKISIIIKIVIGLIFLFSILITIDIVYSHEIEQRFFNECRNNIKFIISGLEILEPEIVNGKIEEKKLKKEIAGILSYYRIENQYSMAFFERSTGKIIYPEYSNERTIDSKIEKLTSGRIEGRVETTDTLGYYFYYKPIDLSILIYNSRRGIFYYRNMALFLIALLYFIMLLIYIIFDIKKNKEDTRFFNEITKGFKDAFNLTDGSVNLREIEGKDYYHQSLKKQLVESYNRMVKRINLTIRRQENKIKEITKQRSNLRKLAYYYKKYSLEIQDLERVDEKFVEQFSNRKMPVSVISFKLIDYFTQIMEVYPEVITRELERLFRRVSSIVKSKNGFINHFEGNYFNAVFGLSPNNKIDYGSSFNAAILTAKEIHNWILRRNNEKNFTGVSWKDAIGITYGNGITGVIGSNIIVIGKVVDLSRELMELAEEYGVHCVTDSGGTIESAKLKYRKLDRLKINEKEEYREIYEVFLDENTSIDYAIKLYQHGLEMYFEDNYEVAATEFKKVNKLLNPDFPSLKLLNRINSKISQDKSEI